MRSPAFFNKLAVLLSVCVMAFVVVPTTSIAQEKKSEDTKPAKRKPLSLQKQYELMRTFVETYEQIERNYVKDIDERELMEAAIQGMLLKLDPYSSYINREEVTSFNESVDQEFGGIGIQVHIPARTGRLTVVTPLPGTPAYKAGIQADDTIMEIEDESTEGFTIQDAVKRLKGKPGEAVRIGVLHRGTPDIEQISIVRDIIQVNTVLGDKYKENAAWDFMFDPAKKVGYVRLTHFSRRSAEELNDAMESLIDDGLKGLVLDLRDNPGGLLSQAVEVCDMFIEKGMIVSTRGRNSPERSWEAHKQKTFSDFPMAILVNRYSASASEIVSACLQDHKRAVVVGERSWGKGSVQNVINLEAGASALKLTTASYHRPSGKNIHRFPNSKDDDEWGVTPDDGFGLRLDREEYMALRLYRRDRDTIRLEGPPKSDFEDRQFKMALDYVVARLDGDKKGESGSTSTDDQTKSADKSTDGK